jgi:TRAP-type C4-dicarboxylate transport system substrate-binding protein
MQEPADYLSKIYFGMGIIAILASETGLSKLSQVDRDIVLYVAERRSIEEAYLCIADEGNLITQMSREVEVINLTDEQNKRWENAFAPFLESFLKRTGDKGKKAVDILQKYKP